MNLNEEKILKFWQWFVKNEGTIKNCIENESSADREVVVDQLNEHILSIGTLTWDIGLDDTNSWFLTVSPNGDKDLFKVTKEIMSYAPDHMNWVFYSSKPAKIWDRTFGVYNTDFDVVDIDASYWHYIAFEEEDGRLELIIEARNIIHLDYETALTAANQFVIHEIGEALKIERVASVEIVDQLDEEYEETKYSVDELKDHLEEEDSLGN